MLRNIVICSMVAAMFISCDKKEKTEMQTKIDSLQTELEISQKMANTLTEVGSMIDSIDASRQLLRVNKSNTPIIQLTLPSAFVLVV